MNKQDFLNMGREEVEAYLADRLREKEITTRQVVKMMQAWRINKLDKLDNMIYNDNKSK